MNIAKQFALLWRDAPDAQHRRSIIDLIADCCNHRPHGPWAKGCSDTLEKYDDGEGTYYEGITHHFLDGSALTIEKNLATDEYQAVIHDANPRRRSGFYHIDRPDPEDPDELERLEDYDDQYNDSEIIKLNSAPAPEPEPKPKPDSRWTRRRGNRRNRNRRNRASGRGKLTNLS